MTPEETTETIHKYFNKWFPVFDHWGWHIGLIICDSYEDMPGEADENTNGICFITWDYLEGDIYFNRRLMKDKTDKEIEGIVVHEFCHFLVAPMQKRAEAVEISVTMIARTLLGMVSEESEDV